MKLTAAQEIEVQTAMLLVGDRLRASASEGTSVAIEIQTQGGQVANTIRTTDLSKARDEIARNQHRVTHANDQSR